MVNTALEAITVLKDRLSTRDVGIIYRAVEKIDTPDKRYLNAIKDRLDKGNEASLWWLVNEFIMVNEFVIVDVVINVRLMYVFLLTCVRDNLFS